MKFDFTKNRTVEELTVVPENCRAFYEKIEPDGDDGAVTYNLRGDAQTIAAVAVITGQNKALVAVRQEVKDAKDSKAVDLTGLSDYGQTIDEIVAGVNTKVEELTANASGNESDIAIRVAAVKKDHSEAMAALTATKDGEIATRQGQLENYMIETSIMHAGAGWQGLNPKLVSPFARQQMKVLLVDEKPSVVVVDAAGEARYSTSPERAGELMNTDELFEEMSKDKALRQIFPSDQAAQGGGAAPSGPASVRRGDKTKNMNAAQKISEGLKSQRK